jgi:NDP-sugar pyrophosphorylase family protein
MRALLLAAGRGERLKPITDEIPKVMVDLNGKPCILYAIENLKRQGIKEFAINTHYLPEKIKEYLGDGSKFNIKIVYSYEKEILGTSGALNNFKDFFKETFIVVYSDVLANFDLKSALRVHKENKAEITITLDTKRNIRGKGAVIVDKNKVISFLEKPEREIPGALINSGFYILEPSVIGLIPNGFSDFAKDIIPILVRKNKIYCNTHKGYIFDIGTSEDLEKARANLSKISSL